MDRRSILSECPSLICQRYSDGIYVGLRQTSEAFRKHTGELTTLDKPTLRWNTSSHDVFPESHISLCQQTDSFQPKCYQYRPETGFLPICYEVPWYRRLERYNCENQTNKIGGINQCTTCKPNLSSTYTILNNDAFDYPASLSLKQSDSGCYITSSKSVKENGKRSKDDILCMPKTLRSPQLVKETLKRMRLVHAKRNSGSEITLESDGSEKKQVVANSAKKDYDVSKSLVGADSMAEMKRTDQARKETIHDEMALPRYEIQRDNLIEEMVMNDYAEAKSLNDDQQQLADGNSSLFRCGTFPTGKPPSKPPRDHSSLQRRIKSVRNVDCGNNLLNKNASATELHPLNDSSDKSATLQSYPERNADTFSLSYKDYIVVVAIDFGTAYSGYAFAFTRDPENIHVMRKWEGAEPGIVNQKTDTTLLLTPNEEFHSFGHTARDNYLDLDRDETCHWMYFEKFKLSLLKSQHLNKNSVVKASNGRSINALTVFAHALRYFKERALQELSDQSGTDFNNQDVRWVITVPAIWTQPAKQFMRIAAYLAGLASIHAPEQLLIALEPEAASIFCRRLRNYELLSPGVPGFGSVTPSSTTSNELAVQQREGKRYMVVDCGGGTVDITVHEFNEEAGVIKEIYKATGGPHGSLGIDKAFKILLENIFGSSFMAQFKTQCAAAFVDLMTAFEARKRNATPFKITPYNIALPFCFIDYFFKIKGYSVEDAIKVHDSQEVKWSNQGMLRLEPMCMQKLFQPTLHAIKQHIRATLENVEVPNLDYLFLVGGFADSSVLQKCIRETFSSSLKVIIPHGASLAVLKGAVLFGVQPHIVFERRSLLTYGVGILNRFVHGVHPIEKFVVKDEVEWCADVLDKFVLADQPIRVGDTVMRRYASAKPGQSCIVIHVYCCERRDVEFVTDTGVQRCGTLVLDLPPSDVNQKQREIQTTMIFGETELKVNAIDIASGKCVKAQIDLLGDDES